MRYQKRSGWLTWVIGCTALCACGEGSQGAKGGPGLAIGIVQGEEATVRIGESVTHTVRLSNGGHDSVVYGVALGCGCQGLFELTGAPVGLNVERRFAAWEKAEWHLRTVAVAGRKTYAMRVTTSDPVEPVKAVMVRIRGVSELIVEPAIWDIGEVDTLVGHTCEVHIRNKGGQPLARFTAVCESSAVDVTAVRVEEDQVRVALRTPCEHVGAFGVEVALSDGKEVYMLPVIARVREDCEFASYVVYMKGDGERVAGQVAMRCKQNVEITSVECPDGVAWAMTAEGMTFQATWPRTALRMKSARVQVKLSTGVRKELVLIARRT